MFPSTSYTLSPSPLGKLTLTADSSGLTGVYYEDHWHPPAEDLTSAGGSSPALAETLDWLATFFGSGIRKSLPTYTFASGTAFQKRVWSALAKIPDGETCTYGQIAEQVGSPKAVRAVGAAIGRNPISILIPCHRVIGSDGSLTGYAGGLKRKKWLLEHEKVLLPLQV
ncbi:MAG: methylated-DNA--[protein]-cysteine S-methyltransferase [Verrucomicrobiota bacterium]